MKLDPGSTEEHPSVTKTATPAIIWVVAEVTLFTALLGLGMHALAGLEVDGGQVNAPGHPVEFAAKVGASRLVLGASRRNMLLNLIRGNLIRRISRALPETIKLIVYASDVL